MSTDTKLIAEQTVEIVQLRLEVERLRAALERINLSSDDPWTVAREALEKNP